MFAINVTSDMPLEEIEFLSFKKASSSTGTKHLFVYSTKSEFKRAKKNLEKLTIEAWDEDS